MSLPSSEFQIRATVLADLCRAAARVDGDGAELVPASTLQLIGSVSPDAWLAGALVLELYDRVLARGGEQLVCDMARRAQYLSDAGPMLRLLRRQALRFMGRAPGLVFRWVPGARAMTLRNCGEATYESIDSGCRIVVVDAPRDVVAHQGFRAATRGSFLGVLDLAGAVGDVTVRADDTTLTYEALWWARRGADDSAARPEAR